MTSPRTRLAVAVAIACAALLLYSAVSAQDSPYPLLGKPAPNFSLNLADGGKMNLADHKTKEIVVLDFWATWCPPCRQLMPVMVKIADEYKAKGVVFYGVNVGEDAETVKAFQEKNKLKFNAALDSEGLASGQYGARSIPMSVIIDKNGIVQAAHLGLSQDLPMKLMHELDALLGGKSLVPEAKSSEEGKQATKPEVEKKPEAKK